MEKSLRAASDILMVLIGGLFDDWELLEFEEFVGVGMWMMEKSFREILEVLYSC